MIAVMSACSRSDDLLGGVEGMGAGGVLLQEGVRGQPEKAYGQRGIGEVAFGLRAHALRAPLGGHPARHLV